MNTLIRRAAASASIALVLFASISLADDTKPMTNQDVLELLSAGLGDRLVITKIEHAKAVAFEVEVEQIIALKNSGVSESILEAMLERGANLEGATPPAAFGNPANAVPEANRYSPYAYNEALGSELVRVFLAEEGDAEPLRILRGELTQTGFLGYGVVFMDYPGLRASVRTRSRTPSLLVHSHAPVTGGRFFFAKLDSDTDDGVRSLKISSFKKRSKSMFGGSSRHMTEPDQDWVLDFNSVEESRGVWRVTPRQPLPPGEYGWYVDLGTGPQATGIYDFGVD